MQQHQVPPPARDAEAVPEALAEALPAPPEVAVEEAPGRLTLSVRASEVLLLDRQVLVALGVGGAAMLEGFLVSFLAPFYESLGELFRSPDGPFVIAPLLLAVLPPLYLVFQGRLQRLVLTRTPDEVVARLSPGRILGRVPGRGLLRFEVDSGGLRAVYDSGDRRWLLRRVRDGRLSAFLALRLGRPLRPSR